MPCTIRVLRMNFSGEYLLANHGDPQLESLRYVRLKYRWAVANRLRVTDIAFGDDLGASAEGMPYIASEGRARYLAYDMTVMMLVEVQEVARVIRDERRRNLKAECACQFKLRGLETSLLDRGRDGGYPATTQTIPSVLQEVLTFLF